ncbi:hypothetical protein CRI94_07870 [Longibacter salinarum]|uniref:Uncharacterized protein n=1 Tax=Longibacter salinarum TaxID=1850348 RepID=A0A2A8CZC7_9BACT|nr:hypothetical protein [Longibacter salinarum]PEN13961.1 hypothetical protein CRI94_07870 [Longibacter salinarum]
MAETEEVQLEPGSRESRLYEVFAIDLWWSLGMMAAGLVIAGVLFASMSADALRIAGLAVGAAGALTFAARLIALRGLKQTRVDEWLVILGSVAVFVGLTEAVHALLQLF